MNIILIGFKNVGKTTIGKQLAEQLQWEFMDTDHMLQDLYNHVKGTQLSIPEIHKQEGENGFRGWEHSAIEGLEETSNTVLATGGGSVLLPENVEIFKKIGKIIYLQASKEELLKRQENTRIPTFINKEDPVNSFLKIYSEREVIYESVADYIINVEGKEEIEILIEILSVVYTE